MRAMNLQSEFSQKKPTQSRGRQSPLSTLECLGWQLSLHLRVFFCLCGVSQFSTPCRAPQRPSRTTAMIHRVFKISLFSWLAEVRHHKPSFCLERLSKWNCHLGVCASSWWWPLQGLFVLLGCTFVVLDGCCAVIANVLESPLLISDDKTDSVSWTVPIQ